MKFKETIDNAPIDPKTGNCKVTILGSDSFYSHWLKNINSYCLEDLIEVKKGYLKVNGRPRIARTVVFDKFDVLKHIDNYKKPQNNQTKFNKQTKKLLKEGTVQELSVFRMKLKETIERCFNNGTILRHRLARFNRLNKLDEALLSAYEKRKGGCL